MKHLIIIILALVVFECQAQDSAYIAVSSSVWYTSVKGSNVKLGGDSTFLVEADRKHDGYANKALAIRSANGLWTITDTIGLINKMHADIMLRQDLLWESVEKHQKTSIQLQKALAIISAYEKRNTALINKLVGAYNKKYK